MNRGSACGRAVVWLRFCGPARCTGVAAACPYVVGAAPHRTPASRTAPQEAERRALSAQEPPRHANVVRDTIIWSCKKPARPQTPAA